MREDLRKRARVLVLDDEPQNVRYVSDVLVWAGYEHVEGHTDPHEALARFGEFRPDLVILDLLMPGMNGFEVMEALQETLEEEEYLPFLVLTSDISSESRRRALSSGARDFLTKPMSPTEVRLRVDNLLETRFLYVELARTSRAVPGEPAPLETPSKNGSPGEAELLERWGASLDLQFSGSAGRSKRVSWVAGRIAEALELPAADVDRIRQAARLHELGAAAAAPPAGEATRGTARAGDPAVGVRLLQGSEHPVLASARRMLAGLEERWDGSGSPGRLRGEAIALEARIVAVARHWDDLEGAGVGEAERASEIEALAGTRFDPGVVDALVQSRAVGA